MREWILFITKRIKQIQVCRTNYIINIYCRQQSTGLLHLDGFESLAPKIKEKPHQKVWFFWQGHKDLNPEPTVLETRLINQPLGGLLLKLIFQLSKSKSPPQPQNSIKNQTNWEFQKQAYGLLGLRSFMPKPSAQKVYHNPLIYARFEVTPKS